MFTFTAFYAILIMVYYGIRKYSSGRFLKMKKVFEYLKYYKKESILAPLLKMGEALLELVVPLVMASIIDRGIPGNDRSYIVKMTLLLVLIGFAGLAMSISAQFFAAKAAVGVSTKMRLSLFSHIHTLSYAELDRIGESTLTARLTNDVNSVQNGVNMTLRLLLRSPFVVFGAMIMAFTVSVRASLIFILTIPLLSVTVFAVMSVTIPMYKKVQSGVDRVFAKTSENLSGIRVIRAFCKEKKERADFESVNERLTHDQKKAGAISALINPLTYVIINISIVVLLWQSGIQVNQGELSQGETIALYNYMSQILVELIKMANLVITVTRAIACAKRVEGVFAVSGTIKDGNETDGIDDCENSIEFRDVSLTYAEASAPAVDGLDFSLKRGQTLGIIGGTGSGKSTLINMIPRFYDATSGEVLVLGRNVKEYKLSCLRGKIGIVPQRAVLFRGTVRDNIKKGKHDATDEEIKEALITAQAGDILEKKGLDAMIEEGGKNLSGGQKQRLTIARALVRKPEILILDDSASALDFATDKKLRYAIAHLSGERSVVIVSQRTAAVRSADKILVLQNGKICGTGTHDELLQNCEVYREIYESQFKKEDAVQ